MEITSTTIYFTMSFGGARGGREGRLPVLTGGAFAKPRKNRS